jgi:hypothetical protein
MRLLKSRQRSCPCKLTGGLDLLVFDEALAFASDTACQTVRGEMHPTLKYGLSTVVDGDMSVQEVLGFSNDADQSGRAVTVF